MGDSTGKTRVLIPGVCHPIASETLARLRYASEDTLYIVGVDLEERGDDHEGVDAFYFVPPATSPHYVRTLLDVCRKERIELVVPWSDLESAAISEAAGDFGSAGVSTLCGPAETVRLALDKASTLEALREHGVPVPAFARASTSAEVERAARERGYPESTVVVKPCMSSGCMGLWFLEPQANMQQRCHGPGQRATLPAFVSMMREYERGGREVPEYVAMEFLPGDDYSVDALASKGEAVYVVPRRRIRATEGISRVGEIAPNAEVRSMVARVVAALGLHLNVNVQLKYSEAAGGHPLVYEVNPRLSGSIVANDAAGAALFFYGIQLALGRPIPPAQDVRLQRTRMFRRWVGRYTHEDEWFTP